MSEGEERSEVDVDVDGIGVYELVGGNGGFDGSVDVMERPLRNKESKRGPRGQIGRAHV